MMSEIQECYKIAIPYGWTKPRVTFGDCILWRWSHYENESIIIGMHYLNERDARLRKQGWHYQVRNIRLIDLLGDRNEDLFLTARMEEIHESDIYSISGLSNRHLRKIPILLSDWI